MSQTFHVEIACTGAAFGDETRNGETARMLREAAAFIDLGVTDKALHDVNGNRVGSFWFEEDRE